MSVFAQAMQEDTFIRRNKDKLVEVTVRSTLSYVAQAFRSNKRLEPRLDTDGKTFFILQEHFKRYRNKDGNKLKQKDLHMTVMRRMLELAVCEIENLYLG